MPLGGVQRVGEHLHQMTGVVEPGLWIRSGPMLEQGQPERAVDQEHGPRDQQCKSRRLNPERGQAHPRECQGGVERHPLGPVGEPVPQPSALRERYDHQEEEVVDDDKSRNRSNEPHEMGAGAPVRAERIGCVRDPARRQA